jgi:hypothetical protein
VPDLAHRHELREAGRGGGQVLEDGAAPECARERPGLQLVPEPFLLRLLGVHRDGVEARNELRKAVLLGHLAQDDALSPARRGEAQGGGDGGLSDPSLAGHEDQPLVE